MQINDNVTIRSDVPHGEDRGPWVVRDVMGSNDGPTYVYLRKRTEDGRVGERLWVNADDLIVIGGSL